MLRHCGGVNDAGVRSVALRCKQLQASSKGPHSVVGLHLALLPGRNATRVPRLRLLSSGTLQQQAKLGVHAALRSNSMCTHTLCS